MNPSLLTALLLAGFHPPSPLELLRIGLCVLAVPFLFRALRDERVEAAVEPPPPAPDTASLPAWALVEDSPSPPQPTPGSIDAGQNRDARRTWDLARRAVFAVLGALVLFLLSARVETAAKPSEVDPANGFQHFTNGVLNFHLRHSKVRDTLTLSEDMVPSRPRRGSRGSSHSSRNLSADPVDDLRQAANLVPTSANLQRYCGVALAEKGDLTGARQRLERAMAELAKRAPERARVEQAAWRTLFGQKAPTPQEIEGGRRTLEGFGLGWLARVAALAAYQRLGKAEVPTELRDRVANEANQYCANLILGGICNLVLISELGLVFLIVGIVLVSTRALAPIRQEWNPVSAPLWESFILMFVSGLLARPLTAVLRPGAPETQPELWAVVLILSDALQLLALLYLWLRLRARGLTLAEVGFTRKNLGANIAIGVMAACVLIPTAAVINIVTDAVTRAFFPDAPPAYHPLVGMTAGTVSPAIRWALWGTAAIGAPLIEETFFRGALFGALRRRNRFIVALLGSSAFFAILHPQLPLGFMPIALLGAGFACLYEWRRSLVPGMVAHAVNNTLAFVMMSLIFPMRG